MMVSVDMAVAQMNQDLLVGIVAIPIAGVALVTFRRWNSREETGREVDRAADRLRLIALGHSLPQRRAFGRAPDEDRGRVESAPPRAGRPRRDGR
jgi:hypothetical protein